MIELNFKKVVVALTLLAGLAQTTPAAQADDPRIPIPPRKPEIGSRQTAPTSPPSQEAPAQQAAQDSEFNLDTLSSTDVFGALEDLGENLSQDLAKLVEAVFEKSGKPTAVIVGSEWQGSVFIGYRKGSGKIMFKGQTLQTAQPIYWRAPSIGLNVGGTVSKVAILVYGAKNSQDLFQKFAAIQGSYHMLVGAGVSYLRSNMDLDDQNALSLAYITIGAGIHAGLSIQSVAFSDEERWFPQVF